MFQVRLSLVQQAYRRNTYRLYEFHLYLTYNVALIELYVVPVFGQDREVVRLVVEFGCFM